MNKDVAIELSVRVTDGSFETKLVVPVGAGAEQHKAFVKMWLDGLRQAIAMTNNEEAPNA